MAGSPLVRVATRLLENLVRRRWGFAPNIVRHLVEQRGAGSAARWLISGDRRYEAALRALGPLRAHLACVTISLLNGCGYCAYAHAYAVELHHLKANDRLFPVDARTIASWAGLPRPELRTKLHDTLMKADLHLELMWVDRSMDLAEGGRPIDEQEARIAYLVRILGILNEVGVTAQPEPDEAHDVLNKDVELKARLAALRAAQLS